MRHTELEFIDVEATTRWDVLLCHDGPQRPTSELIEDGAVDILDLIPLQDGQSDCFAEAWDVKDMAKWDIESIRADVGRDKSWNDWHPFRYHGEVQ